MKERIFYIVLIVALTAALVFSLFIDVNRYVQIIYRQGQVAGSNECVKSFVGAVSKGPVKVSDGQKEIIVEIKK